MPPSAACREASDHAHEIDLHPSYRNTPAPRLPFPSAAIGRPYSSRSPSHRRLRRPHSSRNQRRHRCTHRPRQPQRRIEHHHVFVVHDRSHRRDRREGRTQLHQAGLLPKGEDPNEPQSHRSTHHRYRRRGLLRNNRVRHKPLHKKRQHRDRLQHPRQDSPRQPAPGKRKGLGSQGRRPL